MSNQNDNFEVDDLVEEDINLEEINGNMEEQKKKMNIILMMILTMRIIKKI